MNLNLLSIIKHIVTEQGIVVLSDYRRIAGFLADLAQDVPKRSKNAIIKSLEYNFVEILKNADETECETCKQQLAQKLHDEEGLDLDLCRETLDLLANVLFTNDDLQNTATCKNCGKEIAFESKFCSNCGNALVSTINKEPEKTPKKSEAVVYLYRKQNALDLFDSPRLYLNGNFISQMSRKWKKVIRVPHGENKFIIEVSKTFGSSSFDIVTEEGKEYYIKCVSTPLSFGTEFEFLLIGESFAKEEMRYLEEQ